MTNQEIVNAIIEIVSEMRLEMVPYDTGNMALNSLRVKITHNEVVIYLDQSIAPYVPYTNEPWLSPKWHGKSNPNEGWWERFVAEFTSRLTARLRGGIQV